MPKFEPGKSGNPGGRPKGYAGVSKLIMEQTRNGAELVEYSLKVLRDDKADWRDRSASRQWLSDMGIGPAPKVITLEDERRPRIDVSKCSPEQLAALESIPDEDALDDDEQPHPG